MLRTVRRPVKNWGTVNQFLFFVNLLPDLQGYFSEGGREAPFCLITNNTTFKHPDMVKLQILAKDVMENNYFDFETCPITRALRRAGYLTESTHEGVGMLINGQWFASHKGNTIYLLNERVTGMYVTKYSNQSLEDIHGWRSGNIKPFPIEDFEVELDIPEPAETGTIRH